jgi:hypothetical protein
LRRKVAALLFLFKGGGLAVQVGHVFASLQEIASL